MKHVTYADKSMLVGDQAADLLIEYAARLASQHTADSVDLHIFGADGGDGVATFLLGEGAPIIVETVQSSIAEPDNSTGVAYMQERIAALDSPHYVQPEPDRDGALPSEFDDIV